MPKLLITKISTDLREIDNLESMSCVDFRQSGQKIKTGEFMSVERLKDILNPTKIGNDILFFLLQDGRIKLTQMGNELIGTCHESCMIA